MSNIGGFKERLIILFHEKSSNDRIIVEIEKEFNVSLTLDQINRLRKKYSRKNPSDSLNLGSVKYFITDLARHSFSNEENTAELGNSFGVDVKMNRVDKLTSKPVVSSYEDGGDNVKSYLISLFLKHSPNNEIIAKVKAKFGLILNEFQLDKLRNKYTTPMNKDFNNLHLRIIEAIESSPIPIKAVDIFIFIKSKYRDFVGTKRLIRQVIWRDLMDEVQYDKNNYTYALKNSLPDIVSVDFFDFFNLNTEIDLSSMTKRFIQRDQIFLNSGFRTIDKLINSYLYKSDVSELDIDFLNQKLTEYGLDFSVVDKKRWIKFKNFHKLEDLIHIIYEDHLIKEYELEYLKKSFELNDIPESIANKRFWQISLFYYYDDLKRINGFSRLFKLVYILLHVDFESSRERLLSFDFIDIFNGSSVQELIVNGQRVLEERLREVISRNNCLSVHYAENIDDLISRVKDLSGEIIEERAIGMKVSELKNRRMVIKRGKTELIHHKTVEMIFSDLTEEETKEISSLIISGNRLSAFFKYSNAVAGRYDRKEIEENFEILFHS